MSAPYCYLFEPEYAEIQHIKGYELFQSDFGIFPIAVHSEISISLPRSPFGGFLVENVDKSNLFHWLEDIVTHLTSKTQSISIKQPGEIYPIAREEWLINFGFQKSAFETGHFVPLAENPINKLHVMQRRKLKSNTFQVALAGFNQAESIHHFIQKCRLDQNLQINISLESMLKQLDAFPERHLFYTATYRDQLAAACIVTIPTNDIAYYYLPATNAEFKKDSPMVSLMAFMYEHLASIGIKYLDLGISSIDGVLQTSLITFKERMGGLAYERPYLTLQL